MVEKISDADVDLIEMNISCPNVKCGGIFGRKRLQQTRKNLVGSLRR